MSLSRRLQPLALAFAMAAMPMAEAMAQQVYDVADVVETLLPTVAQIEAENPPGTSEDENNIGSGFVYDAARGYIITNHHVVGTATTIAITINNLTYDGTLVASDAATDIAVVQITPDPAYPLIAVRMGNSDALRVGTGVIAIGAPFGMEQTVTTGIISARDRVIGRGPYEQYLQTDAAINPGNSGGPLYNVRGELVGMNTAIFSPTGASAGIGFSIPSNQVAWVADQLIQHGAVNWGYLGAGLRALTDSERTIHNIPANREGVVVSNITNESPAKDILQAGDVITAVNGTPINNPRQLRIMIGQLLAGTPVEITVRRDVTETNVVVTLGTRPVKTAPAAEQQPNPQREQEQSPESQTPPGGEIPEIPEMPDTEQDVEEDASTKEATPPSQQLKRANLRLGSPAP